MSEDLVKQARLTALMHADGTPVDSADALLLEMADRIEELEGQLKATLDRETASQKRHDEKVDALEAKLAVAVEGFEELATLGNGDRHGNSFGNLIAQNYIAELKGGKDE